MVRFKFKSLITFLLLLSNIYAQRVDLHYLSGYVSDKTSGEPLQLVNVYINGTTIGSSTNSKGYYEILNIPKGTHRIIISMIGYNTQVEEIDFSRKKAFKLNIELEKISYQLDEINVVSSLDQEWIDDLILFKNNFLGTSNNTRECKILNQQHLAFKRNDRFKLIASCKEPLEIINEALGYKIYFELKKFQLYYGGDVSYYGNIRFVELESQNENQVEKWIELREITYSGSRKHFFTALADNKIEENNFYCYIVEKPNWDDILNRKLKVAQLYENIIINDENKVNLYSDDYIMVIYNSEWEEDSFKYYRNYMGSKILGRINFQPSWFKLPHDNLLFDFQGNITEENINIKVYGYWAWEKVADLLPSDYRFPKKFEESVE